MSTRSCPERLNDTYEVQEILASELSSEHTPSISSLPTSPTNPDSSYSCMLSSTCCSTRQTPTVKFAPLPLPDPSRKRSAFPLGVAARSRRSRLEREFGTGRRQSLWANDPAADPMLEDPLITFGKFVRSASKSLWRRIKVRSGFVGQVQPVPHPPDGILDMISLEEQEHQAVNPEEQMGVLIEHTPTKVEAEQWRRSTGTMLPSPGLH